MAMRQLLTVKDVCELLQCSKSGLFKLIRSGRMLPPTKLGHSLRWNPSEFEAWIRAGAPDPKTWRKPVGVGGNEPYTPEE